MATAQDLMAWITELLSGQGTPQPLPERDPRLGSPAGGFLPPRLVPQVLQPGGDGVDRRLLPNPPPPHIPRDTFPADATDVPRGLTRVPPMVPDTRSWPDPFPGAEHLGRPDTFPADATDVPPSITGAGTRRTPDVPPFTTGSVTRETGPDADDIVRRATAEAARRPPPLVPGAGERNLRQPDAWDYIDTALAGMAGGRPVLSTIRDRAGARNATYDAIIERAIQGGSTRESAERTARAITENQALFAPILPSLFSPRTSIVNNRLVETATGRVIADFSDQFRPVQEGTVGTLNQATGVITPATGLPGRRRDLSAEDIRRLRNEGTQLANVSRLGEAFRNTFSSPNYVVGGDLSNWIARNTTHGTPGMREAARWWQDYTRNSELFERHEMFGAALTPTEQAAWRAADINPNMEPGMVRANLATRHRILTSAVQRYAQSLAASGYDATAIGSAFGLSADALGIRPGGRHDDALTTPPGGSGFRVLGVR